MARYPKTHKAQSTQRKPKASTRPATNACSISATTPPPIPTPASPLFALPRELRDMIFDEVWKQAPSFKIRYGSQVFKVTYCGAIVKPNITIVDSNSPTACSPWIFADKQVFREATEQLQRYSEWVMLSDKAPHNDCPPIAHASKSTRKNPLVLSPWNGFSLNIGQFQVREYIQLASDGRTPCSLLHLPTVSNGLLRGLREHIPAKARLRHLKFCLRDACFDHGTVVTKAESSFAALSLASLPGLMSVFVEVPFASRILGDSFLQKTLKEDIEEVGITLLGGNAEVDCKFAMLQQTLVWLFNFKKA
jgi:hypothetical protein